MSAPCPICKRLVAEGRPANPDAPFCSARCRAVDLGRWLGGEYRIAAHDDVPDEDDVAQALSRAQRERS